MSIHRQTGGNEWGTPMGHLLWISSFGVAIIVVAALNATTARETRELAQAKSAYATAEIGAPAELMVGATGSALATAAFGLSALQPETYNAQLARDVIEASSIELTEKDRLTAKLHAADAGYAELPLVLQDVRHTLAVD